MLSVVRDEANEEIDDALATFVINSHMKSHPMQKKGKDGDEKEELKADLEARLLDESRIITEQVQPIEQDLLKKYMIYARKFVNPKLSEIDRDKVTNFYADIRRESNVVGGIPIAVRHIESVLRMAEAFARMQLRDHVRSDDIDNGIEMLLDSFLQSQKHSVARQLSKKFEQYKQKRTDSN